MNRRTLFKTSAAAAAVTLLPAVAQAASPDVVRWSPEAAAHKHAVFAADWISRVLKDRHIIGQELWPIDLRVDLKAPRFEVEVGKAWDSHSGYKSGLTGPRVHLFDGDVKVIEAEMFHYTGTSLADEAPPLSMITRHIPDAQALREKLPGQVHHDSSRFIAALNARTRAA